MVILTSAVVARAVIVSVAHHAPALVGVADTTGAVVIDVTHHAPAGVNAADAIATTTFVV